MVDSITFANWFSAMLYLVWPLVIYGAYLFVNKTVKDFESTTK